MFSACKGTIKRREYKIKSNIFIFILERSTFNEVKGGILL